MASLQTFKLYGNRFGGIEPHFKDYKSAAFDSLRLHLRDAQALPCLFMLLGGKPLTACASQRKREHLDCRIEFARVTTFSA